MNLLLDSVIYGLQKFGGISQYWNELSLRLGHSPQVLVSQRMPRTVLGHFPAIRAVTTSSTDQLSTRAARYLPILPRCESPDLVHSSYYRIPASPSLRLVTTAYDFTYEFYCYGFARTIHSLQKRVALRRSQGLMFISASTRNDALRLYPDLETRRLAVIHLASDPKVFYPDEKPRNELPDLLRTGGYALFVGQRGGYKRFDLAVDALAVHPDLALAVVGPRITAHERELLDRRLAGRWCSLESVSNDVLRLLYTHAEVFVYPSDYEGFGLPILDAMACGCPVVCADRSSFPEVAGDAALLVDAQQADRYAESIAEVLRPAIRGDLVARGLERCLAFTWESTAAQTLSFYREVCADRAS